MFQSTLKLAMLILTTISLGAHCAPQSSAPQSSAQIKETESPMFINLRGDLHSMAVKLDCYFTFEGCVPDTIPNVKDFVPDLDIETIDALVTHLDEQLEGVKVVRSTKHPKVVHLILKDLMQEGYVMDKIVNVQYEGYLEMLPDHLGTLLDQEIKARSFGGFREYYYEWDMSTEVDVNVTDEVVRDVLSGAIPLEGYKRFLWEARRFEGHEPPAIQVRFYGRLPGPEFFIRDLEEYLVEMGDRLGCYFTIEDRPDPEPDDARFIPHRRDFIVDLEITTIDALVKHLDEQLEGVRVVRSTKYPSVVHLIAEDLLQEGYVMDETVTFEFKGPLEHLPHELQIRHAGKIHCASDASRDVFPGIHGGAGIEDEVQVAVVDETFRNLLTGAVPLEGYYRVLWLSVRAEANGTSKVWVAHSGP